MSLSVGLGIARSSLFVTADQTATVSRNVANADNPLYSRKTANIVSIPGNGPKIVSISRAENPSLFRNLINANSDASAQKAMVDALTELDSTVNDPELDSSPAALLSKLSDALQQYASQPQSDLSGQAAVRAARNMANGLNTASTVVAEVRRGADAGMAASVDRINSLLAQFERVNNEIVKGEKTGADITDNLDTRDQILSDLSNEIGIRTTVRSGNDMAIFTDSGVTLFDKSAREVSFDRTLNIAPGLTGNPVLVDGVAITGAGAPLPIASGAIKGLSEVRDVVTVGYQRQLDEMARTLVDAFKESDQSGSGLPDAPGLFTWPGSPAIPPAATIINGLAGAISINPNVDPDLGGVVTRLRDGGINVSGGNEYVYNTTGGASYSDRLRGLQDNLNASHTYDPLADIEVSSTLNTFSTASVSWLEELRRTADSEYQYRETLYQRSSEAFSKATGVNLDEEMTILLELERSYQTSSRLVSTIDSMFAALVQAVG